MAPPAPTPPPLEHTTLTSASGVSAVVLPLQAAPAAETIAYDAFARVDLRVGRVLTAARVPRKDKLLDLTVDTGDERGPRRIVAGLALSFSPEELLGKRVLVVCNLEPRDFGNGLVSEGDDPRRRPQRGPCAGDRNRGRPARNAGQIGSPRCASTQSASPCA